MIHVAAPITAVPAIGTVGNESPRWAHAAYIPRQDPESDTSGLGGPIPVLHKLGFLMPTLGRHKVELQVLWCISTNLESLGLIQGS